VEIGQVVYSKSGRDKGNVFLVLKIENGFAYLVDGDIRKIEKPKKKKFMHIQITKNILDIDVNRLTDGRLSDGDVKKMLKPFVEARGVKDVK